jgi:type I restriction enzyme S subunit
MKRSAKKMRNEKLGIRNGELESMKKAKFKMIGNGSGTEKSFESSCLCASVLKKDAGVVEGDFNAETQRRRGTEFKMTEIGLIPGDWDVKRLGELFAFKNGYNTDAKNYGKGIPVASVLEALSDRPLTAKQIRGKVDASGKDQDSFSLKREDLIFTRSSEILEDVGRSNVYEDNARAMFGGFVIRGRPKTKNNSRFINYLLKDSSHRDRIVSKGAGAQHYNIGQNGLAKVLISLPPLLEQTKIAEALSDVDELLAAMTTLIEKKRAIKQGAMQELLGIRNEELGVRNYEAGAKKVPRRRLPGFSGEWVEKRLGDVCSITTGHKDVNEGCENGLYPFFTCSRNALTSNQYSFDTEAILVAGNGDVGNLHYYCGKFEAYQRTYVLSDFMIYARYLWYELQFNLMNRLNDGKIGSTIPYIVLGQLLNYNFRIPSTVAEQKAIAEVLSDMDAEIEELEAKRTKYESIKQGMMQELLTGKTRLV